MAFSILEHLAVHPTDTAYGIEKQAKIDRPTIRAALRILVSASLVSVASKRKLPTGLERKEYKATPQGIVALLQAHPDHIRLTKEYVRDLAAKQAAFLPLIFGKWAYFRERGVEDIAFEALLLSVKGTESEVERLAIAATGKKPEDSRLTEECVHRHDIYEFMLCRAWNQAAFSEEAWRRWLLTIRSHPKLLRMAEQEFRRVRVEAMGHAWSVDALFESLDAPEDEIAEEPFMWPGGEFFAFRAGGGDESDFTERKLEKQAKYERAKALDEGRDPPSMQELMVSWLTRGAEETRQAKRLEKKRKRRD
jgi:hypothetical protein